MNFKVNIFHVQKLNFSLWNFKKMNRRKWNLLSSRSHQSKVMSILLFLIKSSLHSCFFFVTFVSTNSFLLLFYNRLLFFVFRFLFSFLIFHFLLFVFQFSVSVFRFHFLFFVYRFSFFVFHFSFSFFVFGFSFIDFRFSLFIFFCIVVLRQASSARRPSF